jgi:acyl carrier protein
MRMDELIQELKIKVIDTLGLLHIEPDKLDPDAQLIGGEIGIDSIEVLELVMMIERDYSVRIDNKELGEKIFANLRKLAEYIHNNRPK